MQRTHFTAGYSLYVTNKAHLSLIFFFKLVKLAGMHIVVLRCVCDILNAVLHSARDARHFVCAIFALMCKVLKMFVSS